METAEQTLTKWTIDPTHSEVQFKVKHLMITTVTGSFQKFGAEIEAPGDDLGQARISFWADVDSISTGNEQRDGHLKTAEFFDLEKHPRITFESKGTKSVDHDGSWDLIGDLPPPGNAARAEVLRGLVFLSNTLGFRAENERWQLLFDEATRD